jgi:N-acyl-D-aspartate/D-glutamate deacylase
MRRTAELGPHARNAAVIEAAARSQKVGLDAYPYNAGSTNLRADLITDEYRIMITWSRPHPEVTGRDLSDIAAEWGVDLAEAARASIRPAPSTSRWTRQTCAACCRSR